MTRADDRVPNLSSTWDLPSPPRNPLARPKS